MAIVISLTEKQRAVIREVLNTFLNDYIFAETPEADNVRDIIIKLDKIYEKSLAKSVVAPNGPTAPSAGFEFDDSGAPTGAAGSTLQHTESGSPTSGVGVDYHQHADGYSGPSDFSSNKVDD